MLVVFIIIVIELAFLVVLVSHSNQIQDNIYAIKVKGLFSALRQKTGSLWDYLQKILEKSNNKPIPDYPKNKADGFWSDLMARTFRSRRNYYREVYLKSAAWQRKRALVLKRDNWTCVHCGKQASQVHRKKYARKIGKEPINWLESVCKSCHDKLHW